MWLCLVISGSAYKRFSYYSGDEASCIQAPDARRAFLGKAVVVCHVYCGLSLDFVEYVMSRISQIILLEESSSLCKLGG